MPDFGEIARQLSLACGTAGLVAFVLALRTRQPWLARVAFALDLWTAAGLLQLSAASEWQRIAMAALLITIRKATTTALKRPARTPA